VSDQIFDAVKASFALDPKSGDLIWRARPVEHFANARACNAWNARFAGSLAGAIGSGGYRIVKFCGKFYAVHRLAWVVAFGRWPDDLLDHINGDRADNRLCNLRQANASENCHNAKRSIRNTSGFKGVHWSKSAKKWRAMIGVGGKRMHIAFSDCPKEAHAAYCKASAELHGEFGRVA
jgi:hypothetical protein